MIAIVQFGSDMSACALRIRGERLSSALKNDWNCLIRIRKRAHAHQVGKTETIFKNYYKKGTTLNRSICQVVLEQEFSYASFYSKNGQFDG